MPAFTHNSQSISPPLAQSVANSAAAVFENRLAGARLGVATSLFNAMRAKHPAIAAHCLRVAVGCSAWASIRRMSDEQQERLEIASLLHDLGMLGFPDRILRKSGPLTKEERMLVDLQGNLGAEILRGSFADEQLLETIRHFRNWYAARRSSDLDGQSLPIEARMLAIVEAFDSMTNDQSYRTAMSFDAAIQELTRSAGTQFDPELTEEYCTIAEGAPEGLHSTLVRRWLHGLRQDHSERMWVRPTPNFNGGDHGSRLCKQLMEKSLDPTVMVDCKLAIVGWNASMQTATGLSSDQVIGSEFVPSLVGLCSENGESWPDHVCPVRAAIRSGSEKNYRVFHFVNGSQHRGCQMYLWPLIEADGRCSGATMVFRAVSSHDGLTATPSTQELAPLKKLRESIEDAAGLSDQCVFSVLMIQGFCSLPTGLAELCRQRSRTQDLIGLWNDTCLVVLWPGCDQEIAKQRKTQIETAWRQLPGGRISGLKLAFGLTGVQAGDTLERIVERVGNNGTARDGTADSTRGLLDWLDGSADNEAPLEAIMVTSVTPMIAREKVRGFITDQNATITSVEDDYVKLRLTVHYATNDRRRSDRRACFDMTISLVQIDGRTSMTQITVQFQAVKVRDRRTAESRECAKQIAKELCRYLMAEFVTNV